MNIGGADILPEEILMDVFDRLILLDDMVRFGAVCKSWHSVAIAALPRKIRSPCLLMLAREENKDDEGGVLPFYSLAEDRIYRLRVPPQTMVGKKCFTIGFGWILTVGGQIEMVHLLRRRQISLPLPPQSSLPQRCDFSEIRIRPGPIRKAVASVDPSSSSSCIIMVILEELGLLAFTRPGHKAWAIVCKWLTDFVDVIFYRDKFYAITQQGLIVTCSIDDEGNQIITKLGTHCVLWSQKYLVESCGELLVVFRLFDLKETYHRDDLVTYAFEVVRMEEEDDVVGPTKYNDDAQHKFKFVRVKDLGDNALFVGDNTSFSVRASTAKGCRSNCIYFTQEKLQSSDMGVYNLGDKHIEVIGQIDSLYSLSFSRPPHSLWYI